MCDTLCVPSPHGMLFAKNSDRPFHEAQVVEHHGRRPAGGSLRAQYVAIPDAGAHALVGSRPTWLWGLEHGVNEHGVAVGNEKLWTVDDPRAAPPALIGMDLVRLALERARDADEAMEVVATLLEAHGQGGSCEPGHDEPYFSSFLLADARHAWVMETSGRTWAARPAPDGAAISNRISLSDDWTRASRDLPGGTNFDTWRDPGVPTAIADHRLAATRACVARGDTSTPGQLVATLRHHGDRPWGAPGSDPTDVSPPPPELYDDLRGITVCMHVRGYQATTASMVAELGADGRVRTWSCLGSPCAGVYVPGFPPSVPAALADATQWTRFAALRDRVEADAEALAEVRAVLAPVEQELWEEADGAWASGERGSLDAFVAGAYRPVDAALRALGV